MAYTTPRTWADETIVNSSDLNTEIRDNVSALYSMANAPYRNLLYNGAMQIAQRNTSVASITSDGYYTADRWLVGISSLGTWTQSVENDAPTGSGLRKSLKMLCSTADASPAAGDYCIIQQRLEGYDVQRIAKGTSSAQPLAVSFWVKSNKTGTYNCYLQDLDNNRSISAQYTISASGTWEYETVYFPADTTGAFDNDNASSLYLTFVLGAGSNWTSGTTPTSWETVTLANLAPGQTNLAANTNNYWQVTGVQLETGSVATGFEFLLFGDELRRCQRYYEKSYNVDVVPGTSTYVGSFFAAVSAHADATVGSMIYFKVSKRSSPNMLGWTPVGNANLFTYSRSGASGNSGANFYVTGMSSVYAYTATGANWVPATISGHWTAEAEL